MMDELCFVAIEFPDDPNVAGMTYWYLCNFEEVSVGDRAVAPLGRHNRLQEGVVRKIQFGNEYQSPFPLYLIKSVVRIAKAEDPS